MNSWVPSTEKWATAAGSTNSLNVSLKNWSYSSFVTSFGLRVHRGADSFWRRQSHASRALGTVTGATGSAASFPPSLALASAAACAAAVAPASSTWSYSVLGAQTSIGNATNSEYCLTSAATRAESAYSPASCFRNSVTRVPRAGAASAPTSRTAYECAPAEDAHSKTVSEAADREATVTRSATRNAE